MPTETEAPVRKGFQIRILADKSKGVEQYNHTDGSTKLINPEGGSWPRLGLMFTVDPPQLARIPMSWVSRGVAEGWLGLEGERVVRAKGAPPAGQGDHVFVNAAFIIVRDVEGPTRYRVTHQPGKYLDGDMVTHVDWFFEAELVSRG